MSLLYNLAKLVFPRYMVTALQCAKILEIGYGHGYSSKAQSCIDRHGRPIPWYTYPAIEYLKQLDFSDKSVFEFGSGNSTLFWGANAGRVKSVELDQNWYRKIAATAAKNTDVILAGDRLSYIHSIAECEDAFDVIVVDGDYRYDCALEAIGKLARGGMIILDNSDCFVKTARLLRDSDLIQVDMTGFGPINPYAWCTSFFFHREFSFNSRLSHQPEGGIGTVQQSVQE